MNTTKKDVPTFNDEAFEYDGRIFTKGSEMLSVSV